MEERITREELLEKLFNDDYEHLKKISSAFLFKRSEKVELFLSICYNKSKTGL